MDAIIGTLLTKYGLALGINGLMFIVVIIVVMTYSRHLTRIYRMQEQESLRQHAILRELLDDNKAMISRLATLQMLMERGIACPFLRDNYRDLKRQLKDRDTEIGDG